MTVAGIRRRLWSSGTEIVDLLLLLKAIENNLPGIRSGLSFGEARHVHTDLAVHPLKHGGVRKVCASMKKRDK